MGSSDITKFTFDVLNASFCGGRDRSCIRSINVFIGSAPRSGYEDSYIKFFKKNNINAIVRCCMDHEIEYDEKIFKDGGVDVVKIELRDGSVPDGEFGKALDDVYREYISDNSSNVFFHCVSGLGRSPTCAVYALCNNTNINHYDCVRKIRSVRRESINGRQMKWIDTKFSSGSSCSIQ